MTRDDAPLISVIIPCYNAEAYLAEAIGSALRQGAGPLEVIVIDDGSTDGSARVAQRSAAPLRYQRQARAGIGAARNRGVELAGGRYQSGRSVTTFQERRGRLSPRRRPSPPASRDRC